MPARYAILIPARLGSERLPGKVLLEAAGRPLIQHVWERACQAPGSPRVLILTEDERVAAAVRAFGGQAQPTRRDHASGSDRCAEAAATLDVPVVVNVQGDEPLFAPADLGALVRAVVEEGADIATLGWPFHDEAGRADPSAVKAIRDASGWAVGFCRDFGRATDLARAVGPGCQILHHVGLYAFRRERLLAFPALARTPDESAERLEQLRALGHGWRIRVLDASAPAFGIDTQADLDAFRAHLARAGAP